MLTRRQSHLYTDSCAIFAGPGKSFAVNPATGEPLVTDVSDTAYQGTNVIDGVVVPVSAGIIEDPDNPGVTSFPCKFIQTPNVDDVTKVGLVKRFGIFTSDIVHVAVGTPIDNGQWIVNISLLPDGSHNPNWGDVYKVQGGPRTVRGAGRRTANVIVVNLMQEENPPAAIAAFLSDLAQQGK